MGKYLDYQVFCEISKVSKPQLEVFKRTETVVRKSKSLELGNGIFYRVFPYVRALPGDFIHYHGRPFIWEASIKCATARQRFDSIHIQKISPTELNVIFYYTRSPCIVLSSQVSSTSALQPEVRTPEESFDNQSLF